MSLDLKKKKLELMKVSVAKEELNLRIHERLDEIERLKEHIKIQEEAEKRLKEEINKLER